MRAGLMPGCEPGDGAGLPRHPHHHGKQLGQADAHVRHRRHHRRAQARGEGARVDEAVFGARLVHAVEGDHHGPAQLRELQCQFQVALQVGGIHHQQQHVRRGESLLRLMRLVAGDGRPAIAPQQILQDHRRVAMQVVEAVDVRQGDQGNLLHTHFHQAFLIGRADARQTLVARGGAGRGAEDAGLAVAGAPDNGHARPAATAPDGAAQRMGRDGGGGWGRFHASLARKRARPCVGLAGSPRLRACGYVLNGYKTRRHPRESGDPGTL